MATPLKIKDGAPSRPRKSSEKREAKRRALAESAIETLCAKGYANTSLRDIAEASGHPLATLHYYFGSKFDLIEYCIRQHKSEFFEQMRGAALTPGALPDVIEAFGRGLALAVAHDAPRHRLWFDIRNQSVFDNALRPIIEDIEKENLAIASVIEQRFFKDTDDDAKQRVIIVYSAIDGLFSQITQNPDKTPPLAETEAMFRVLLERLLVAGTG
ncbi:TetR/AcrR family transcriptional regulator [Aliishimia ponticola]|uniref:TetR/AcrR family transcriptional regulator n=1 Tax=Aliishimia ponticola TaxID=2499833 RepID=UPI001456013D|nr:TetR/AcrR family transcriptional regulator [Aliishimia ponticola]